jgi:DNA-binding GntR family transcriptional regulator
VDTQPPLPRRAQVYAELRRRLMVGAFGLQTRLVEERLASELGVSRTPVREAMVRLLADGLVIRHDGGYYAALPDLTQLRDLYDLRITLEIRGLSRAVESSAVVHDASLLEPLRDQWRSMSADRPDPDPQFVVVDEDFHVTLMRASGNAVLTSSLEAVNSRIRAVRMYDFLTEDRIERTITEHLAIVEFVLAGSAAEGLVALRRHVGVSMEVVERRAARAVSQMALHRGGIS